MSHGTLHRPRNVFAPRAQAGTELVWPLIGGFENDAATLPTSQYFLQRGKSAGLGQSNRLAPPVLKQLRACTAHNHSLYVCIYVVKISAD